MPETGTLSESIRTEVERVGQADIVVGIPSYNNANTIAHVVHAAQAGLAKYFGSSPSVIINSDGGSTDGTPEVVLNSNPDSNILQLEHPLHTVHRLTTPYHGLPGKGSAFRTIFQVAQKLGAKACAVVDSDLRSITPEWIELLVRPVLERDFDFVAPYYLRHKYDGTITNSIVYPMTRALYGQRIRQPIGGDFGFSRKVIEYYLEQDVWQSDVARFGIDIWVTTEAICSGAKVCQAFLGAKIHDPKDPGSDLSAMLAQVLGSLFTQIEKRVETWQKVRGSEAVPIFGFRFDVGTEPIAVNLNRMIESFQRGFQDLRDVYALILPPATVLELKKTAACQAERFSFEDDLWVRTVYDYALGHRLRVIDRDHLLRSLTPLYLGWVASFIRQVETAGPDQVEERLENLCRRYEAQKSYLISRWRWPDRFNP